MTRISLAAALLTSWLAFSGPAFAAHSAIDPAPRTDSGWKTRNETLNQRAKDAGDKAQVIFIGDSITQGWEGAGKQVWEDNYTQYNAVNLGIGGDRTQHVLWRLENGNLESLAPKVAVVMIGTNNSNNEDNSVAQIADGIRAIVEKLREKLPSAKILLCPIFPRGENPNPQRGKIDQVNQIAHRLADNRNVIWVDFGYKFLDDQGQISREIMPDYLHLSPEGYKIWADSLRNPLNRALGQGGQGRNGQRQGRAARSQLEGEWIATLPGPNNETVQLPFTLEVRGNRIAGNFHAEGRDLAIEDGQANGSEISWTVKRNRPNGGTLTYRMNATLEDGALKGKATTRLDDQDVTVDWSAKKK